MKAVDSIKRRLERLTHDMNPLAVPPEDSVAFQMRLLVFPAIFGDAGHMTTAEKAAVLALDPEDYAEDDREIVRQAQAVIRRGEHGKHKRAP